MRYLKFKWLQWDLNPLPLSSYTNTQPFSQTGQMLELYCEYVSVGAFDCLLLSCQVRFRVNLHSIVAWMSRNFLLEAGTISEVSIIWPVWLNGWVFVYELSGCGFESHCCHLNFRYRTCFEKGVPWHSGNHRV